MRAQKAFHNIVCNLLLQVVASIAGIILPRLFIVTYGSSINGLITSIKQFLGYLNLVEAGVGFAAITSLYEPLSRKDEKQINSVLAAARLFYLRSGAVFALLVAALGIAYPFIVADQVDFLTAAVMVAILGGSGAAEFFLVGKYSVLLTADQRSYILSNVQTAGTLLNLVATVALVWAGAGVLLVQAVSTAIYVARVVLLSGYVARNYPFADFRAAPDFAALGARWDVLIHQTTGLVVFTAPVVIITVFCGLKEVSVFVVYNMVFAAVHQLIASFSSGLVAGFGELMVSHNRQALQKAYTNFEYIYYAVMTWAYVTAAALIMPFIELYTRGVQDANYIRPAVAALFVVVGVANNIRVPANTIVNSAGHFRETRQKAIIEAAINLAVSVALVSHLGIAGVLLGSVCSYAYRTADFVVYVAGNILEQSSWPTWRRIIRNVVVGSLALLPFAAYGPITAAGYLQWFLWAAAVGTAVAAVIIAANWLAEPQSFKETLARLRTIYHNISGARPV